jgi:NAD(P)H-dependent flavin oxidoreductase YrpB (nitropropane dioxygenase family)
MGVQMCGSGSLEKVRWSGKMKAWPDQTILDLFGIDLPIILAPMAGPGTAALAIAVSNVFTGRPARGILNRLMLEVGPIASTAPAFPLASSAVGPLRAKSEPTGSRDFMNLWSGQAARLAQRSVPAGELTRALASEALARL